MRESKVAEVCPQRIGCDIGDDDRGSPVDRRTARSSAGPSFNPVNGATVGLRETRSGCTAHGDAVRIKKENRTKEPRFLFLDFAAESVKGVPKSVLTDDHGQHFIVEQVKGIKRRFLP